MILTRDKNHGDYEIRSYEPGKLKINETIYTQSLIVGAHKLELWTPNSFQELTSAHLSKILEFNPDLILLGTGEKSLFPDSKLLKVIYEHKIGIEIMATLSACHTFNVLMSEGRSAVAALMIN